ncbi:MAG: translocation/assembly module TamB domain-containing protein [Bryobacterales bacterium]|nr:translocation/assembly module TamB domain-containing protein [Bryobacterales bacterium]
MNRRKRFLQAGAGLLVLGTLALVAVVATLHSDWGRDRLRVYLEETITKTSGGRAEIGSLTFNAFSLTAELRDFVFHGRESEQEAPLFKARRIAVKATALSWFGRKFRVDSVDVDAPSLRIALYADGSTNLPVPEQPSSGPPVMHRVIDLGVRRFVVSGGVVEIAEQSVPLDLRGEDLNLALDFSAPLAQYEGSLAARRLSFETRTIRAIPFDFETKLVLERDDLRLSDAKLTYRESAVNFTMTLADFESPNIRVPFQGKVRVADVHREFQLPIEPTGIAETEGEFLYQDGVWKLAGAVKGSGFGIRSGDVRVTGVTLSSRMELAPDAFVFPSLRVDVLGGTITGDASFRNGEDLAVRGAIAELALDRVSRASGVGDLAYHASVSGNLRLSAALGPNGVQNTAVEADFVLRPTEGDTPLTGEVHAAFTQRDGILRLKDTLLEFPNSHVRADGNIGDGLRLDVSSRRLADFLPALALFSEQPETLLPVELLPNGEVGFQGTVSGDWTHPNAEGLLRARAVRYDGRTLDALSMRASISEAGLAVDDLVARKGDVEMRGSLELALENWAPPEQASLRASGTIRADTLNTILAEAAQPDIPITGAATADFEVQGSLDAPVASLRARIRNGEAYDEPFDELALEANYAGNEFRLEEAHVSRGDGRIEAEGSYRHLPETPRDGTGELTLHLRGFSLTDIRAVRNQNFGANAKLQGESTIAFRSRGDVVSIEDLRGVIQLEQMEYAGKPAGGVMLHLETQAGVAVAKLDGKLADSTVQGEASVELKGDYQSKGRLALNRITLDSIRGWLPPTMSEENLPLSMLIVSNATFQGPLAKPELVRGEVVIDELRLARIAPRTRTLNQERPFELTNAKPIRFAWDGKTLEVADATITGNGTSLSLGGSVTPGNERQQLNLRARGDLDFRIFNAFEPSLEAGGRSDLDLSVRGTFANPDLYGTLDLKDASLYLVGVPNGLDKVNGRVFLYRDRATIEEITAQSGGGNLTLSGFVSYFSGTPNFRLSFHGEDVRVRYPPGVSTSANATLELTGSANQSILSGVVSITRAAVNPRSDLASILSSTAKPVATPSASQNEFLRNMRFDVQVRTAPDVRFDSTLTQDLSGEADLRLRGNPYSPVLLGKVTVNQGEINFFGNRYFIDRGDISFINPLKLEPVLNLDLRTRVRSIDVTLTFSGPIEKLNVNYRSDPPLQLNEIIALLTVGRAPAGSPSLAEAQNEAAQSWQQVGASALVGQAVAAPLAGRLQKFFGVSRIKIDPRLTGVENNPQARLTVEQQVSRDITVTFITNLAGTQQQIVRLEWNFNPQFSMVALRDEDGLFGIDFLYRKRF